MRCWIGESEMDKYDKEYHLQNLKLVTESILKDIENIRKEEDERYSLGLTYLENHCELARIRIDEFLKVRRNGRR